MSAAVTVRRASFEDLEGIVPLFDGYRRFYEQPSDLEGARQFLQARLKAAESAIFVADVAGQLIGFAQLYPSFSSASMKRLWILNDLFVALEARRNGVGTALMNAAETFARETGAQGLALATQKTNFTAKSLYEARGWKQDEAFDRYTRRF
jgi:GNAT superfamily N-acetyltransferase